jgi:hypothetical protein
MRRGHVLDRAADGVLAVQRALRAAQHFDPLHVEHVQQRTLRAGDVDVVQIDADAGVDAPERIGLAHAADVGSDRAGGTARGIDREIGHEGIEVADVLHVELVERVGGVGGDGHRHVGDRLFALARGDGDLRQAGSLALLFLLGWPPKDRPPLAPARQQAWAASGR